MLFLMCYTSVCFACLYRYTRTNDIQHLLTKLEYRTAYILYQTHTEMYMDIYIGKASKVQ